jgi:hypothetical protein
MKKLDYPRAFTPEARANVVRAEIGANRQFRNHRIAATYVMNVTSVFAHEACKLGASGILGLDKIVEEVRDFMEQVSRLLDSRYENDSDFVLPIMFVDGELVASFIRECEDTIEWMQFETELLAIPKTISVAQYPQTRMTLSEAANMSVQPEPHITHGAFAVGTTQNASTPIPKKIANRTATPKEE